MQLRAHAQFLCALRQYPTQRTGCTFHPALLCLPNCMYTATDLCLGSLPCLQLGAAQQIVPGTTPHIEQIDSLQAQKFGILLLISKATIGAPAVKHRTHRLHVPPRNPVPAKLRAHRDRPSLTLLTMPPVGCWLLNRSFRAQLHTPSNCTLCKQAELAFACWSPKQR